MTPVRRRTAITHAFAQHTARLDQNALLTAAHAFYVRENEIVEVEYTQISDGIVGCLPFVNRIIQLDRASRALLHNKSLVLSCGDTQRLQLVLCSQLFGVGKTTFAQRLAEGLNEAFKCRLSYVRLLGLPASAPTAEVAFSSMVISAARRKDVISRAEAVMLRADCCALDEVLQFVQDRLVKNVGVDGAITQLFIHFDEFDLSSIDFDEYGRLSDKSPSSRYDFVWRRMLVPILLAPNFHLIVTGKSPELAILGTRAKGQSPTLVYHAVLGTLNNDHIVDILHRLKVQLAPGGPFQCAFSALGLSELPTALDMADDLLWLSFILGLRHFTGGVPRFVCMALGELLRMRLSGELRPIRELTPSEIASLFKASAPLTFAMTNGSQGKFVTGPINTLNDMLSDPASAAADATCRDLLELMVNVIGQYPVRLDSDAGRAMIQCAARFGAYTDHVPCEKTSPEMIKLVMPGILQEYWRSPVVKSFVAARVKGFINSHTLGAPTSASAGALGDALDLRFQKSFELQWALSELQVETSPVLRGLLQLSNALKGCDLVFGPPVDHIPMGKVLNAGETKMCANLCIPQLFASCHVNEERHVMLTPHPQSHSADRMYSLVLRSTAGDYAAAVTATVPPLLTERALLGFALKNYAASSITEAVVRGEICNFADTVYSLSLEQRKLYGSRIALFMLAPAFTRDIVDALIQSSDTLFPLVVGVKAYQGVPGAIGVKYNALAFDVVVVPPDAMKQFLVF